MHTYIHQYVCILKRAACHICSLRGDLLKPMNIGCLLSIKPMNTGCPLHICIFM